MVVFPHDFAITNNLLELYEDCCKSRGEQFFISHRKYTAMRAWATALLCE